MTWNGFTQVKLSLLVVSPKLMDMKSSAEQPSVLTIDGLVFSMDILSESTS